VFAADFRDRVVHHVLVSRQEPVFEREFIHDSYACRKGKGTLAANDRLMRFLRQATANSRRPAWALHLDVAGFFPSIHKVNVYLHPLDQFVKRRLGVRWYLRYVDDLLLLASDPADLVAWRTAIAGFLAARLRLSLRPDAAEPAPVGTGVDFAGWKAWPTHRVPRRRTVAALRRRVRTFERTSTQPVLWGTARRLPIRQDAAMALRDAMAS
jgi:ornithine cyclodeaminase/alanine dehydrogenase-like protein (mu-crystallin family)